MLAGLPYVLWPVGSLFILASRKKDDPFLHYHAWQGLLWGVAVAILAIVALIGLVVTFRVMPGSSTLVSGALGLGLLFGGGTVSMLVFFTAIFLGWRATEGEMLKLPLLGDFAEEKMLDHTGMTRSDFNKMLEDSFIEPALEPIPFPAVTEMPQLRGKAAEILAARGLDDATPASLKATEILAQRAASAQTRALEEEQPPARPPVTPAPRPASAVARPTTTPGHARSGPAVPTGGQPPSRPAVPTGAQPQPRPATPHRQSQPAAPPQPAARAPVQDKGPNIKSYPLIGGAANNVSQPGPSQRPPQPPQRTQAPERAPAQGQAPVPPRQNAPQIKEVDLVRHYKERRSSAAGQQSDALRQWLSSVDEG